MNSPAPVIPAINAGVYLNACLAPLSVALSRNDVTDIFINRPGEYWLETLGGSIERYFEPALNEATLARLARQVAALSHQGISREHPLLAAVLPDGSRIQIVFPPATRGPMALAIRRQVAPRLSLAEYEAGGAFADTHWGVKREAHGGLHADEMLEQRDFASALAAAVRERRTILISGGTSSGKTTFMNALLREVPRDERLILIEDTPELVVAHENSVGLVVVRGELGEARITANDLVAASLRMRPDRIILGELRGSEAFAFLRAINSGHPGSITTIHADSPEGAIEQLVLLVLQAGTALGGSDIRHYVEQTIDVYVQLGRKHGKRIVEVVSFRR